MVLKFLVSLKLGGILLPTNGSPGTALTVYTHTHTHTHTLGQNCSYHVTFERMTGMVGSMLMEFNHHFLKSLYLFIHERHRDREAETLAEGEAGSM